MGDPGGPGVARSFFLGRPCRPRVQARPPAARAAVAIVTAFLFPRSLVEILSGPWVLREKIKKPKKPKIPLSWNPHASNPELSVQPGEIASSDYRPGTPLRCVYMWTVSRRDLVKHPGRDSPTSRSPQSASGVAASPRTRVGVAANQSAGVTAPLTSVRSADMTLGGAGSAFPVGTGSW